LSIVFSPKIQTSVSPFPHCHPPLLEINSAWDKNAGIRCPQSAYWRKFCHTRSHTEWKKILKKSLKI
jgi:hypothetical protein